MLQDTLVFWAGEFGRTPMRENRGSQEMARKGRDHNPGAFTLWMPGAGVKPGMTHGENDPIGFSAALHPVKIPDMHATLLQLLGLDYKHLSPPFQGLRRNPTGVIREILS